MNYKSIISYIGKNTTTIIDGITATLTTGLAVAAFVLSYNALTDMALQLGVPIPTLIPLVIEGGMIVFSMAALRRNLHGQTAGWQWVLIIASSALATGFNIAHAQANLPARVMAALPSIFLLLSFETLLSQVRDRAVSSEPGNEPVNDTDDTTVRLCEPGNDTIAPVNDTAEDRRDTRRRVTLELLRAGMSQSDIAKTVGVSLATTKRDVNALNGAVKAVR